MAASLSLPPTRFFNLPPCDLCSRVDKKRNDGTWTLYCGEKCSRGIIPSGKQATISDVDTVAQRAIMMAGLGSHHALVILVKWPSKIIWVLAGEDICPGNGCIRLVTWIDMQSMGPKFIPIS